LGKQQHSRNQIDHEQRRGISWDEGVDPLRFDRRERPDSDDKGDEQREHDGKSEPLLREAWRQG
jgi:hypothetical protein